MVMPFIGFILGPIGGIHTGINIVVGVIMMWVVRVSVVLAELSVRTLREGKRGHVSRIMPNDVFRGKIYRPSDENQTSFDHSDGGGSELRAI
jgi:hypothetical protein